VFPSVAVAALTLRTGLFATILGALTTHYVLIEPQFTFDFSQPGALAAMVAFLLGGSIISGIVSLLYAAIDELQVALQEVSQQSEERRAVAQEMNHRIKNYLQILAAMIRMQALSDSSKAPLENAADRIATMGRIHDQLFRLEDTVAHLDSAKFIAEPCASLQHSLIGQRPVRLEVAADPVEVALSQATTIGLLINEVVTNSVKHAFPDGMPGTISVSFRDEWPN
jgi:two-component system, sensor histidine kinase PdtaS